jgi:AcrR family transcriptional regulator
MTMIIGQRAIKSANIKSNILNQTLQLLKSSSFKDLFVTEICSHAKVSKVTLFKYFPRKEDILAYYFRIWCFERTVTMIKSDRHGLSAISHIFTSLGIEYEKRREGLIGIISYMTSITPTPYAPELNEAEKSLLFKDDPIIFKTASLSFQELISQHIKYAIKQGEISSSFTLHDTLSFTLSMLYGTILSAHHLEIDSPSPFFKSQLVIFLKALKSL